MATATKTPDSVVLIEDETSLREDVGMFLRDNSFRVFEASGCSEGIRYFREAKPSIVVLDMLLAEEDVAGVLTTIAKESPDTPVILVAADGKVPEAARNVSLDPYTCLTRPIVQTALDHAIRHVRYTTRLDDAFRAHLRYLEKRNVQLDVRLRDLETTVTRLQGENVQRVQTEEQLLEKIEENADADTHLEAVQTAIDHAMDAIAIVDANRTIVYHNAAFDRTFGRPGAASSMLANLFTDPRIAASIGDNVATLGNFSCEVPMVAQDRHEFPALVRASAVATADTGPMGTLYIFSDITEQERLRQEAYHDALTGMYSRRHFLELLGQNLSLAKRHGHALSLSVCDLDEFKQINDTYGHAAGDEVLQTFARAIAHEMRNEDVAGRFGGDEFCLFFPHVEARVAAICLERIRRRFAAHVFTAEHGIEFSVSATFGIADIPSREALEAELIELADKSLYKAKEAGRNCTVVNMELYG